MSWLIAIVAMVAALILFSRRFRRLLHLNRSKGGITGKLRQLGEDAKTASVRREILRRVSQDTADRLIKLAKLQHPGKTEHWYLDKVLYDLKRGR